MCERCGTAEFKGKGGFLLVLVVLALAVVTGCRRTPDETQIRAAITAIATAAEAGSPRSVSTLLSDDFDGNSGELDQRTLVNLLRVAALRGERIGVTTGPIGIEHRGARMVASFTVTLSSRSRVLPDHVGLYQVVSAWRKVDGEWRCYLATWEHTL